MRKIQMVDVVGQYEHIQPKVDKKILEVIQSGIFIGGPEVKAFEEELGNYLGSQHVVACGNGTDALQIAMMALGLKPGDEVITANFTYAATAEVIALLQLTPVLVDVNPETFMIDPDEIEKAISPKTKAIVPVHLFGQCAPMERIMQIADKHNLYVIEDNAQAIGADYTFSNGKTQKAGTIGHIGCTSFYPSKNLGCYGDGGAMYTNDEEIGKKMRMYANHGQTVRYYHDTIGVNSRLDAIQAAVLRIKLPNLDAYCTARQQVAAAYDEAFAPIEQLITPVRVPNSSHVFHQYTLIIPEGARQGLQEHLSEHDIPSMIYYPVPLHHQKAYRDERYADDDFPVTNELCKRVISLPVHTEMTAEQLAHITTNTINYFKKA